MFGKEKWNPDGKNCCVTGGSQGLGLSLAILLAQKGANVTIIARTVKKLEDALKEIEKYRQSPNQKFRYHSFALDTPEGASTALEVEWEANEKCCSDAYFLCAGSSRPSYWVEDSPQQLKDGMNQAYWVQAWAAHKATQLLVQHHHRSKIVFVGSTLSLMGMVGYTSYAPGKHALRGLAETLRSELLLYKIDVHIFLPPTMFSPGYEVEMQTKPDITKKIEEDDMPLTTEQAAAILLQGVIQGHHHISGNFITKLFRSASRGSVPSSNGFVDFFLVNVAWIAIPIWRAITDRRVAGESQKHRQYLANKGFFANTLDH